MLIEMLLDMLYGLFSKLLVIDLPDLPAEATQYIETAFEYITPAGGIIANFTPLSYLMTLFTVLLAIDAGMMVYKFVMWIIKKIPMLGIQ